MKETWVSSLAIAIELVVMALVVGPAWAFGCVHPPFELWIAYGIGVVLLLAAAWKVMRNQTEWLARPSSIMVASGLYGLFLISTLQYLPIGSGVVSLVSPAASAERAKLLPEVREVLKTVESSVAPDATTTVQSTLSLNPSGSYYFSLRILGLVALFVVVCGLCRSEVTSTMFGSFLLRLSIAAAMVGTAMALFSIAQKFSSPPNKLYWYYDISQHGFGPFINRNHYPFFANMTLGLAVGLLLHRYEKRGTGWANLMVNDNAALWIVGAIVFIVAGIVICVSRGGFVAMLASVMLMLIARSRKGENLRAIATFTALGVAVLLLLGWIGFDFLSSRLTTITDAEAIQESGRFSLWSSALQAGARFPLFGSGGETYTYWESMLHQSDSWNSSNALALRCDNEFIDLFCEYGVFASLSAMLIAVALLRRGFFLARNNGLAAGAFMAMTAVTVHSCMDFGLRVPASGVLATIIAAALCSVRRDHRSPKRRSSKRGGGSRGSAEFMSDEDEGSSRTRSRERSQLSAGDAGASDLKSGGEGQRLSEELSQPGLAPYGLGVAMACVLVAMFLVNEKRRIAASDAAYQRGLRALKDGDVTTAADELVRATRVTPEDAKRHRDVAGRLLDLAKMTDEPEQKQSIRQQAVRQAIMARDQSPLAYESHLYLGQQYELLSAGDPQITYFERAQRLHPSNCDIAYALGSLYYEQDSFDKAWQAWHASLEFIPNHLAQILDRTVKHLSAAEVIERVLPAKPALLMRAAEHSERVGRSDDARLYLARVAEMLEQSTKDADSHELLARVYAQMQQTDKAIDSYRLAIQLNPGQMAWRMELVKLLIKAEQLEDAQREVRSLLVFEPDNVTVQAMKTRVEELMREARRKK